MEVINFGPGMDLSNKEVGDTFLLRMGDEEFDVVVKDAEEDTHPCNGCVFNDGFACMLTEAQDFCLRKNTSYKKL